MLEHGIAVQLSPLVRRIVAPNAGFMTGPGTNTYIIGRNELAVIDPGPRIDSHIEAILDTCAGKLRWLIVTHTHPDHSPAAAILADRTGVPLLGNTIADDGYQDTSFVPGRSFEHGERFETPEFTLTALHTPGHVDNHYCFLVEEDGLLLTGDHLMNGSTVVIIPPHGDMRAYIESLRMLTDYPLKALGPGHGDVMEQPQEVIRWTIDHRLARENKVLCCLRDCGGRADLDRLLPLVYDDVDAKLHTMARMSLWAHLIKLEQEQSVLSEGSHWQLTGSAAD